MIPTVDTGQGKLECIPVFVFGASGLPESRDVAPLGYAQAVLTTTAVFQVVAPAGTRYLLAMVDIADARWRDDGADPTATVGMPLAVGATLIYDVTTADLRFTAQAAGSVLNLAFYGDTDA